MTQRTNGETVNVEKRITELLEEESTQPLRWWYLSYADEHNFRGGIIVEARGFATAVSYANRLMISPGGEVQGIEVPADQLPGESYRYRLLTLEELGEFWEMKKLSEL